MSVQRTFRQIAVVFALLFATQSFAAGDANAGKALFINNCASCHNKNMKSKMTGPALAGVEQRWAAYPKSELYTWIRNSSASVASGQPRAVEVWNEYKPTVMTAFPSLKDADIDNMLAYINQVAAAPAEGAKEAPVAGAAKEEKGSANLPLYLGIAGILGLLAFVLNRIINNLALMQTAGAAVQQKSIWQMLASRSVIGFLVFALVVLGGYTTVNNAISLGRQQDYKPTQPIKFSHATHSGVHKIDCQYCHDSARRSKHSSIPGTNTCMNCHSAIKVGSQHGTAELTKIYVSTGFDPSTDKYVENYANLAKADVEKLYKSWIAGQAKEADKNLSVKEATLVADRQWSDIVTSMTGGHKKDVRGPIEWTRIHNLADHVYFNHAQHVAVGKVECSKCHGPAETMEVMKQYAPLSMGWCINCHRETEVKFADNDYYKSYERYHKELKEGTRSAVTVADIGGLECQKCHY